MGKRRASFTLRFENQELRRLLQLISEQRGISMNRLIEGYVAKAAARDAQNLETEVATLLHKLQTLQRWGWSEADMDEAAQAEASFEEPIKARRVTRQELEQASSGATSVRENVVHRVGR